MYKTTHINKDLLKIIVSYVNGCCSCPNHIKEIPRVDVYAYSAGHDAFNYDIVESKADYISTVSFKMESTVQLTKLFTHLDHIIMQMLNKIERIFVEKTESIKFNNLVNFLNTTTYYSIINVINYPGIKETWYHTNNQQ